METSAKIGLYIDNDTQKQIPEHDLEVGEVLFIYLNNKTFDEAARVIETYLDKKGHFLVNQLIDWMYRQKTTHRFNNIISINTNLYVEESTKSYTRLSGDNSHFLCRDGAWEFYDYKDARWRKLVNRS